MPRNNQKVYALPPGTRAQPQTKVRSEPYNTAMQDIANDLNAPRPPNAGGTGETTLEGARTVLGAISIETVDAVLRAWVAPYPANDIPPKWLKCDGAEVSRSTYAALYAIIGPYVGPGNGVSTFNLPDYRGEFIRGLDQGRGVDPGRVLNSFQASDVKSHTHAGSTGEAGAHSHPYNAFSLGAGSILANGANWGAVVTGDSTNSAGAHTHPVTVNSTGGAESRPRNIAMIMCIRF